MRKSLLIAALLLVLLPCAILAGLVYTPAGLALIATQLDRLERFGVHVEGVSGTLSGPLRIARFELDHPRVRIESRDIEVDLQLRGLLLQTIRTGSLTASDTLVLLREVQLPPSNRPPRFLPPYLRIDARGVDLTQVRYLHTNGTPIDARRVQGNVTLTARRLHAKDVRVDAQQFDAEGELRLRAGRPLALAAELDGHWRMPRGDDIALSATLAGNVDRLDIKSRLLAPEQAVADVVFTRPGGRWRLAGRVAADSFSVDQWLSGSPFSLRDVALDIDANPDRVEIAGKLAVPEFQIGQMSVAASGRFAQHTLHIATADLALHESPVEVHAAGDIAFDGEAPRLNMDIRWQALQWPLRDAPVVTSALGSATVRGPMPYDFALALQMGGPGFPAAQGSAKGVLSKEAVDIAQYDFHIFEGLASGKARLQFAAPHAWQFSTRAENINPATLYPDFPGRLDVSAQASGAGLDRQASFALAVSELSGSLRSEPVAAGGELHRLRTGWRVQDAHLAFADARLALDGTLQDTLDVRWSLHAPSLKQLLPHATGSLDLSGTADGLRRSPHVATRIRGTNLGYQGWSVRTLHIDADIDTADERASALRLLARGIGAGQPLIDTLSMTGEGTVGQHRLDVGLTGFAPNSRAAAPQAQLQLAGRLQEQRWDATLTTTRLSTGAADEQITIAEPASALVTPERAALSNLCVIVGAGRLCADGEWERGGSWQGAIAGYEIPLAMLLPPAAEAAEYSGRIEGRVRAFGSAGQPWQAEAGMRIIDAAIIYRPQAAEPETLNLGTGGLAATASLERIDFSFGLQAFTDTYLYANAQLLRDGNALMRLPLTGNVRARAADANILPLFFPEIDNAAGLFTANVELAGTLAMPEMNGRLELTNGEFDSYRVNLALRELNLIAELTRDSLGIRGTARAGEGQLEVGGKLAWQDGESQGSLQLRGENMLVADLPEYRVVASPDLTFRIDGRQIDVTGGVTIPSAGIHPVQFSSTVRASDDAQYVGEHPAEKAGRFTVNSNVRIAMGDDVRIDAFGLQGRIRGAVDTMVRTGETALGRGELTVEEGRYEAYGQKLAINRGRLLFDSSSLDDPGLDIEARREVETVTVGLNVRGTLREPRLTFFSDPSMAQTQIVSYLLTGKSIDTMRGGDRMTMDSARSSLAYQGGGVLASQLGRRLGIEEVGVESSIDSAGESNTSLVLGKFLSPRLFISYGISLTESINTLKLRYTISDRWIFRTEAGEDQSADLEYTIEK